MSFALALLAVTFVIWVRSLASGVSGGVLAPLVRMGAALSTALSPLVPGHQPALWHGRALGCHQARALCGHHFPIETTRDWNAAVPVFLATVMGTLATVLWVRRSRS